MCFFNSQNRRALAIAKRYGRKTDIVEIAQEILDEQRQGKTGEMGEAREISLQKAFLNPECWIVTRDVELLTAKWGLIPFWVRDLEKAESIRNMTANARSETVFTQASFRAAIRKRRCLVPSTSFFEYHYERMDSIYTIITTGSIKTIDSISSIGTIGAPGAGSIAGGKEAIPYRIFLRDTDIFSLAGVYEEWVHPGTKEMVRTFSVVTVPANELCGEIHNGGRNPGRMPAIIPQGDEERWLEPELTEKEICGLLKPYNAGAMDAVRLERDYLRRA
jgi:putative SOS response-associated peptidase YedK